MDMKYPPGVKFVRDIYVLFLILTAFLTFVAFATQNHRTAGSLVISFLICFAAFIGIYKRKDWVVSVVLIASAWGIFNVLVGLLESSPGKLVFILKAFLGFIFLAFYLYCIFLFSKKEIRLFFKEKGKILF